MDGDRLAREQDPAYRATLLLFVTASNWESMSYFRLACLVVIGTWLIAKSFLLSTKHFYSQYKVLN